MESARQEPADFISLLAAAIHADSLGEMAQAVLPRIASLAKAETAFLFIADARMPAPAFNSYRLSSDMLARVREACLEWLACDEKLVDVASRDGATKRFALYRLGVGGRRIGLLGVLATSSTRPLDGEPWEEILAAFSAVVDQMAKRASAERRLHHLRSHLAVSSVLARSVDLSELLEIVLYSCMDAVSAEAASLLVLDEEKESFEFYQVEGAAKPLLAGTRFPASEGLAGRVLRTQEAEVISDVQQDSQFYDGIDLKTGFRTRSAIAVPLSAADERIGVLEVLNKAGGEAFTAEERLLLAAISDEIAYAVRNAGLFDFVIASYCKRRQGQNSCDGCERSLDAWTPCLRYRESLP